MLAARGFLDAHWEYPNFLPDDDLGLKVMPFQLRERTWQEVYAEPVNEAILRRPDETICFRIIGKGFVAPRKPATMSPADRQFIFVEVKELRQLESNDKCVARMSANGS